MGYQNALLAYEKIDKSQNSLEKEVSCAELANTLRINLQTFASQQRLSLLECLIFVRCSSLFPRKDQLENIDALCKKECVLQKIMGGRKISVIAAIWVLQQAKHQNKLPEIFAESSLYQSLIDNLKPGQYATFQQHIFTINPSYAQLHDSAEIEKIFNQLKEGFEKKRVLIMKGETLQMLDLNFQKFSLENSPTNKHHREGLRKVLNFFKDHVSGLADAVDLIVHSDFEVNVPTAEKHPPLPSRIDLVREMFTFLASHPSLGIREGDPGTALSRRAPNDFSRACAEWIDYKPLQLKKSASEVKEAFCTYLLGSKEDPIPEALKDYTDLLRNAREAKEASELIALCRYLVSEILPSIFKQSPGVQFGKANRSEGCTKVVPFVGVDTPSTRKFRNPYEWLSKQFFTSVIKGISLESLNVWIKQFVEEGSEETSFQNCTLKETRISKQFQALTGQNLEDPDKNKQFVADLFKKLEEDN